MAIRIALKSSTVIVNCVLIFMIPQSAYNDRDVCRSSATGNGRHFKEILTLVFT
jgi:hypothetical protein